MPITYITLMLFMMLATLIMIRQLYEHLEQKENRELLLLVVGLFIDFIGCVAISLAKDTSEIIIDHRISIVGRCVFGIGFILYHSRSFHAKLTKFMLTIWVTDKVLCFLGTLIYRKDNFYLTDISINVYRNMSILSGNKQPMYFVNVATMFILGIWAVILILKEHSKIKKNKDKIQNYILAYFGLGITIQGISVAIYELEAFKYPDISPVLRGFMAIIYSVMASHFHFISYEALARDTLLSDIGAGFVVLSTKYRILYYNDVATDAFPELLTLEGMTPYSPAVKNAIDLREMEIQRKGETYRITADRIYNKRKLAGYSLLIVNVTDFLSLEKQAKVSRDAKEKLLTNMAHELRTPINAISGEAEMMLSSTQVDMFQEYAHNIQLSVERLNDSFNYLLEAFNEETEIISPVENPYNFYILLDTIVNASANRAYKKNIEFDVEIDPNLHFDAIGDDAAIYKLVMNVLINAIRYTENGKVSLYTTSTILSNGFCNYEFVIADTGEQAKNYYLNGMENATDIFEEERMGISFLLAKRFISALDGQMKLLTKGARTEVIYILVPQKLSSGNTIKSLGMQDKMKVILLGSNKDYWKGLVDSMKSLGMEYKFVTYNSKPEIEADDKIPVVFTPQPKDNKVRYDAREYKECFMAFTSDKLTTLDEQKDSLVVARPFSVLTLRRVFSTMGMIQEIISQTESIDFIAPSVKALVVDDEYLNRKVAVQILENFKIKADAVSSGYECLDLIKEGKTYDIIFMDYMMEELNGIETTQQIRDMERGSSGVTILAFTANDAPGAKEKYLAAGMNGILFKPAGKEDFAKVLRKFLPEKMILEKIGKSSEEEVVVDFEIEGLNTATGLTYVSGNVDAYKSILVEFGKEIYDKAAKISEFYSLGDLYDFTIYVHGVKSSSRMIGLEELGNKMAALENAGKNDDLEYIGAHLTETLDLYESYVSPLLSLDERKEDNKEHSNLYKLVSQIKSAAEDFEMDDVEVLIKELSSGNYGQIDQIDLQGLNESVKAADYYELVDNIENLLKKIEAKEKNY